MTNNLLNIIVNYQVPCELLLQNNRLNFSLTMAVMDVIRSIANVGNGTIIGVLFGSASYLCYDTFVILIFI